MSRCTKGECSYSLAEREVLTIIGELKIRRPYVEGTKSVVRTDHQSLLLLFRSIFRLGLLVAVQELFAVIVHDFHHVQTADQSCDRYLAWGSSEVPRKDELYSVYFDNLAVAWC